MRGAEALIRTLKDCGVDCCFANPGTSEMYLVQGIEAVPGMRAVLGLFEGVCTGAADGYARMTGRPAMTLLHLGPGLANGLANLHNARRAHSPVVNVVGDHATYHVPFDAPLTSDIEGLAAPMSGWVRTSETAEALAQDGADAVAAAMRGQAATLIVPGDCSWGDAAGPARPHAPEPRQRVADQAIDAAAEALRQGDAVLLLGGQALGEAGLRAASRIAAKTGARVLSESFAARTERGAGRGKLGPIPYFPEDVLKALGGTRTMILAGAPAPVSFFAYPGQPSGLVPEGAEALTLATPGEDAAAALEALADAVKAPKEGPVYEHSLPERPKGPLTPATAGAAIAALLPEGAIVMNEAATSGGHTAALTQTAAPHTWLNLTGGSIGNGLPVATGAAIACPDRKVLCLHGDGGAMYTNQSLWTQAREGLDVTTVIFSNRRYFILEVEYARAGVNRAGPKADSLFDLGRPDIDWAKMAQSMGVDGTRAETAEDFTAQLERALAEPGPHLIEAVLGAGGPASPAN